MKLREKKKKKKKGTISAGDHRYVTFSSLFLFVYIEPAMATTKEID